MFTGIIKETGKVLNIQKGKKASMFIVGTKTIIKHKKVGESIAVNGVCVTITKIKGHTFEFDAIPETLGLTNFQNLKITSEVNLEPAMKLGETLDGHLVQGHVDTTGKMKSLNKTRGRVTLTIKFPKVISKYLALKGSVSLNGVSLTISGIKKDLLSVDLIPHTLSNTNLGKLKKGDKINIEVDLISRYLKKLLCK